MGERFTDNNHQFAELLQNLIKLPVQILDEYEGCLEPKEEKPCIFQQNMAYFGGFYWNGRYYLIGPCTIGGQTFTEKHQFARQNRISLDEADERETTYQILGNALSVLYFYATGEKVLGEEIWRLPLLKEGESSDGISEKELFHYRLNNDFERRRTGYALERKYYECIKNGGDISVVDENTDEDVMKNVGEMAESGIKQYEYLAVETVTMSTRAAIKGGMDIEAAYELSDMYLQRLEKCSTQAEMLSLTIKVMNDFSKQVRLARKKRGKSTNYVEKCKAYLEKHVREKIDMKDMAAQIGLNYSYLSRNFSEHTGMTLTEYARKEKLKRASNMLRYTELSIADIADYFSFSSAGRFSGLFKAEYGMNPAQYRSLYFVNEFLEKK